MGDGVVSRWAIRTAGDPTGYADAVLRALATYSSRVVVTEVRTMDEIVETAQATTRLSLIVIGAFGMFAGLLAPSGCTGVLATLVQRRTAEWA